MYSQNIPKLEQQQPAGIEAIQGIRIPSPAWVETLYSTTGHKVQKTKVEKETKYDNIYLTKTIKKKIKRNQPIP